VAPGLAVQGVVLVAEGLALGVGEAGAVAVGVVAVGLAGAVGVGHQPKSPARSAASRGGRRWEGWIVKERYCDQPARKINLACPRKLVMGNPFNLRSHTK